MRDLIPKFKALPSPIVSPVICPKCEIEIGLQFVGRTEGVIAAFRKCPNCRRVFNWKAIEKRIGGKLVKSLALYLLLKGDNETDVE